MPEPWFRPDGILRFRPITWQGKIVLAVTYLTMISFGIGGLFLTDSDSAAWWITAALAFSAFVAGHAVVLWKMDWDYGRR
ncbi:hypothetical protein GCM10023325_05770 [Sphingomonas lutea]